MPAPRAKLRILVAAVILVGLASVSLRYVFAPPPPSSGRPLPLTQYGVVRVYASTPFTGTVKIKITSQGSNPFFIERLTLFLSNPADFDILLDSVNVDGTGTIQISGFSASPNVVVVPARSTVGDVVTAIPTFLSFLVVADPMRNEAIVVTGGDGNGLVVGIRFISGGYGAGTTMSAIATVVAPTNAVVTMTMS